MPVQPYVALAECALHLRQHMEKLKAGPLPGNQRLHPVRTNSFASPSELAYKLYALVLAPLATAVVFSEGEFGGIDAVLYLLAGWVRCLEAGEIPRYRPRVVVFCRRTSTASQRALEEGMTAEILATCNFAREMTAKSATAKWRSYFSGIDAVPCGIEDESAVYRQAVTLSRAAPSICPPLPGYFGLLLLAACEHFARSFPRSFNLMRGSRAAPVGKELARQIEILSLSAKVAPASLVVASALLLDSRYAGLAGA